MNTSLDKLDTPDDSWESTRNRGPLRRLRLRRKDGKIYLDRWGIGHGKIGRIFIHHMTAPDPGADLHDHPWWFVTIPLWGGYTEQRANIRDASEWAMASEKDPTLPRGRIEERRPFRPKSMRLDECHTITGLRRRTCWTLVLGGPIRRRWGFYLPERFIDADDYDEVQRRVLWSEKR